jgi:SpoVK/Ycf46/Vps4 family AAA+-type ATPase
VKTALLKRLFSVIHTGSPNDVEAMCRRIVDEERKHGHNNVADDLQQILEGKRTRDLQGLHSPGLSALPVSKRDSAPLVHVVPHDRLRHHMVLSDAVEARFRRIEKEFAAQHRLAAHGLKPSRRILFYGPPGCGKSLGAERLAWATGLALHKVRFDTLLSSFFGESLGNLRRIFDQIGSSSPSALFLDECDTLARSRTERNDVGETNRITNALLELLEGYPGDGLVIAATNLDSALDTAFFRRFDEVIKIPLPSTSEIARLLKTTLSAIRVERNIDWFDFARQLDGMSSSEVVQIAQTAAKRCVMDGGKTVRKNHLSQAVGEYSSRAQS